MKKSEAPLMDTPADNTRRMVAPTVAPTTSNRHALVEHVLQTHPGVQEAAVVRDGDDRLVAFVVPDDGYMDNVLGRATAASTALGKCRKTFDLSQLTKDAAAAPVGMNTIGWNSSYTRQPIPAAEMREWVEASVAGILKLGPKAVYEIGCGTGLLLMRIGPVCDRYVGADFSPVVLGRIRDQLRTVPALAERIEVEERSADDFDGLDGGSFDTVVINSVVQYFPSVAYLTTVLERAVDIVRPGGSIYVGDIRSLPLLPAFASSVELFQAANQTGAGELRQRIRRRVAREPELVLSPAYFLSLRRRFQKLTRVDIQLRPGRAGNEMVKYRFNAVLHVNHEPAASSADDFLDWTEREWTVADIRSRLIRQPHERVALKGIPNARIEKDLAALAMLSGADAARTAADVRLGLERNVEAGIHPQALIDLETEGLGFAVLLSWAACRADGTYDACFVPLRTLQGKRSPAIRWPEPEARACVRLANAPGQGQLRSELIDRLLSHCRHNLPEDLVPRDIALVDTLARNADGDVDPSTLLAAGTAPEWS